MTSQGSATTLEECWALQSSKKATRFSDVQKRYLEDKLLIGQGTGHKLEPVTVARDMRYAKYKEGKMQFTVSEFLTAQQIQSFFSRKASKLRHAQHEADDNEAAEEQEACGNACTLVLKQVLLCHPIIYDTYNMCVMYKRSTLGH